MKLLFLITGLLFSLGAIAEDSDKLVWSDLEDENYLRELFRDLNRYHCSRHSPAV